MESGQRALGHFLETAYGSNARSLTFPNFWLTWPITNSSIMYRLRLTGLGLTLLATIYVAIAQETVTNKRNKEIPTIIENQVLTALSHYPDLKETNIRFLFTDKLKKSIMVARPTAGSLFKRPQNRTYNVLINPAFKLDYQIESIRQIPDSVMIGWIGHELGHIMDYERKSTWKIMGMGISYWLSKNYVRKAERIADSFAVNNGMGAYLTAKKSFVLDHAELPQAYKDKIQALYPSPSYIEKLMADLEREAEYERETAFPSEEKAHGAEVELAEESHPGIS